MYHVWIPPKKYSNQNWLNYDWKNNSSHLLFKKFEKVDDSEINFNFIVNPKVDITELLKLDFFMSDATDLVSEKLASIISKKAKNDVQLLKAKLYQNEKEIAVVYIPNFLVICDCIDIENSIYLKDFDDFSKLTFKKNSIEPHCVVKAKGYETRFPIVNYDFVQSCLDEKCIGLSFEEDPFFNPRFN